MNFFTVLHNSRHKRYSYLEKVKSLCAFLVRLSSHCPNLGTGFLKDSQLTADIQCPCAASHMEPNQYSTVLDWKLDAVSTRMY